METKANIMDRKDNNNLRQGRRSRNGIRMIFLILFVFLFVGGLRIMLRTEVIESETYTWLLAISAIPGVIVFFNLAARGAYGLKMYYLSSWNILTSKHTYEIDYELPAELMYDKMVEVFEERGYKIRYRNKQNGNLMVSQGLSFWSWGENLYVDFVEKNNVTTIQITSVAFSVIDWDKNRINLSMLLEDLDDSMVI